MRFMVSLVISPSRGMGCKYLLASKVEQAIYMLSMLRFSTSFVNKTDYCCSTTMETFGVRMESTKGRRLNCSLVLFVLFCILLVFSSY